MKQPYLFDTHQQAGAKMTPFAGYQMPVWYSNLKAEHLAVRQASGLFDISHMGVFKLSGEGAFDLLQKVNTNDVTKSLSQTLVYSMILNNDGGILDDVMFGALNDDFLFIVNAGNKDKIYQWLKIHNTDHVRIEYLEETHVFLAVQGPKAANTLSQLFQHDFESPKRFSIHTMMFDGHEIICCRSGYTGEDGYELIVPEACAKQVWKSCIDAGIVPCGLAARDTLRVEYGLPLYGHELSERIHPYMTRYPWVVSLDKFFIGKEKLMELKEKNKFLITVGFKMSTRMIPRQHYKIIEGGEVTSGTLSPSLNYPIGMAFVSPEYSDIGAKLTVDIRGKQCEAVVVKVPFI